MLKFFLQFIQDQKKMELKIKNLKPCIQYMEKESADQVARLLENNKRIIGLTRGQFSLIDLIYSIIKKIGPSHIICATWSAGIKDANTVQWMLETNLIKSFTLVTDHSYVTRQPKYSLQITDLFGKENIRTTDIHAKFCLIKSENFNVTIRTSMNLNANRTCENFEIDTDLEIYTFYDNFIKSTFKEMPSGFTASSTVVNRALNRTFNNLKNQFNWQKNE